MYQRICQPNAADGSTTAPTHLLLGHVSYIAPGLCCRLFVTSSLFWLV